MTLVILLLICLAAACPTLLVIFCVVKFFQMKKAEDAEFAPPGKHQSFIKETLTWIAYLIFSILYAAYALIKMFFDSLLGRPRGGAEEVDGEEEDAACGKYTDDAGNRS